ncbi:MAG: hypothetical protein GXO48_08630 [Chlorobi bacterium]|nr:hypothetical protein [Chlorobiota bacterium]
MDKGQVEGQEGRVKKPLWKKLLIGLAITVVVLLLSLLPLYWFGMKPLINYTLSFLETQMSEAGYGFSHSGVSWYPPRTIVLHNVLITTDEEGTDTLAFVEEAGISWSLRSIVIGNPKLYGIWLKNAYVKYVDTTTVQEDTTDSSLGSDTSTQALSLPKFRISLISLENVRFDYLTSSQKVSIGLEELEIEDVEAIDDNISIEDILLNNTEILISTLEVDTVPSDTLFSREMLEIPLDIYVGKFSGNSIAILQNSISDTFKTTDTILIENLNLATVHYTDSFKSLVLLGKLSDPEPLSVTLSLSLWDTVLRINGLNFEHSDVSGSVYGTIPVPAYLTNSTLPEGELFATFSSREPRSQGVFHALHYDNNWTLFLNAKSMASDRAKLHAELSFDDQWERTLRIKHLSGQIALQDLNKYMEIFYGTDTLLPDSSYIIADIEGRGYIQDTIFVNLNITGFPVTTTTRLRGFATDSLSTMIVSEGFADLTHWTDTATFVQWDILAEVNRLLTDKPFLDAEINIPYVKYEPYELKDLFVHFHGDETKASIEVNSDDSHLQIKNFTILASSGRETRVYANGLVPRVDLAYWFLMDTLFLLTDLNFEGSLFQKEEHSHATATFSNFSLSYGRSTSTFSEFFLAYHGEGNKHSVLGDAPWMSLNAEFTEPEYEISPTLIDSLLLGGTLLLPESFLLVQVDSLPVVGQDLLGIDLPKGLLFKLRTDQRSYSAFLDVQTIKVKDADITIQDLFVTGNQDTQIVWQLYTGHITYQNILDLTYIQTKWKALKGMGKLISVVKPSGYPQVYFAGSVKRNKDFYGLGIDSFSFWYADSWWFATPSYCVNNPENSNFCVPPIKLKSEDGKRYIEINNQAQWWSVQAHNFPLRPILLVAQAYSGYELDATLNADVRFNQETYEFDFNPLELEDIYLDSFALGTWQFTGSMKKDIISTTWKINGEKTASVSGNVNKTMSLNIHHLPLSLVQPFTVGIIDSLDGYLKTENPLVFAWKGYPSLKGAILLRDGNLHVDFTGVSYKTVGTLNCFDDSVDLTLVLNDREDGLGTMKGFVLLNPIDNPPYNLNITTNKLKAINTGPEHNPDYYGNVTIKGKVTLQGDATIFRILIKEAEPIRPSEFYMPIYSGPYVDDESDFIVFVDRDEMLSEQGESDDEEERIEKSSESDFALEFYSKLNMNDGLTVVIPFDPPVGDILEVVGEGPIQLHYTPTGEFTMMGEYVLTGGSYTFNFKNLLIRRFNISEGSIRWLGSPYDGVLDIHAIYTVRTPATNLLLYTVGTADSSLAIKYVTAQVHMFMKGTLSKPELTFKIDVLEADNIPEIRTIIRLINADPLERDYQAFSLLATNQFAPPRQGGGGTVSGGALYHTVSEFISQQLTSLAQEMLGAQDLQLHLGYQSGTGLEGTTAKEFQVAINKAFMNKRLIVDVTGNVLVGQDDTRSGGPLSGSMQIEYLLTKDGRWRWRVYSQAYQDFGAERNKVRTGMGIRFIKHFDSWEEIIPLTQDTTESND